MTFVKFTSHLAVGVAACLLGCVLPARAVTTVFFDSSQATNFVAAGATSDTISSEGYLFTYTRDKLFTGGVGLTNPIGRYVRIFWPNGLEAQAVTTGPNPSGAKITISRQDGQPFDITSFTGRLLANTAGAGGSFEIMPKLNGEDAVPDPFMYAATGIAGNNFNHNTTQLTGFDSYTITLYVDFALMNLTVVDASVPPVPDYTIATAASPVGGGTVSGAGIYPSNSIVTLTATPNAGYVFLNWSENGVPVSSAPTFDYNVYMDATLTAEFAANLPPVSNPDAFLRTSNLALRVSITDLLANDSDPDGDPISVIDVSAVTTNHVPLTWDGVYVYYPATNANVTDSFTYTIADIHGQTTTTNVTINICAPSSCQIKSITSLIVSNATVNFTGTPGYAYVMQRTTNFVDWVNISTNVAPASGLLSVQDDFADLGGQPPESAYFRLMAR